MFVWCNMHNKLKIIEKYFTLIMSEKLENLGSVMILNIWTDGLGQILQTQIREEQSDQGFHCLLFHLHHFEV